MPNDSILVSVLCPTYNQKKYIAQCLDSVLGQETDFAFEVIVKDDCSTDGTSDIIREYAERYPDRVRPLILEENYFSQGKTSVSFVRMFNMIRGKYFAVCEGDDFWTDPKKLQIQADFMEAHPDYSMCCHSSYLANEDGSLRTDKFFRSGTESGDLSTEKIISGWAMATNTVLIRTSSREEILVPFQGKCVNEDYGMEVYAALKGKVYYLDRMMSAYRMNASGSITASYKVNPELLKGRTFEFCNMLDRLNEYSEHRYDRVIRQYREKKLFDMYAVLGDRKNMIKHKSAYADKPLKTRALVEMRTCFPKLANTVLNIGRKIRK